MIGRVRTWLDSQAGSWGGAAAIAVITWIVLIFTLLLVVFAGASSIKDGTEIAGNVGQLVLGVGVALLTYGQFRQNRLIADRQHRVEAFAIRQDLVKRYRSLAGKVGSPILKYEETNELYALSVDFDAAFSEGLAQQLQDIVVLVLDLSDLIEERSHNTDYGSAEFHNLSAKIREKIRTIREKQTPFWEELREVTKLT